MDEVTALSARANSLAAELMFQGRLFTEDSLDFAIVLPDSNGACSSVQCVV